MPTYDYECRNCHHEFELFQSINDSVKRKCPECGRLTLKRLIGPGAAIVFKGSGFYQTDYRSESYKKKAASENKASSDKKGASDGKPTKSSTPGTKSSKAPAATSSK